MLVGIARAVGFVVAAPFRVLGLALTGVGYAGLGIEKPGAAIKVAGFTSAEFVNGYADTVGIGAEDLILGLGAGKPEAEKELAS